MIYPQIFYQTLYFLSEFFHKRFNIFENNIISVKLAQVLEYYLVAQSLLKLHEGGKCDMTTTFQSYECPCSI